MEESHFGRNFSGKTSELHRTRTADRTKMPLQRAGADQFGHEHGRVPPNSVMLVLAMILHVEALSAAIRQIGLD